MPEKATLARLNRAVQDCLRECAQSSVPLNGLAEFCQRLRQNPDWVESEIYKVERTVHKVLKQLVQPDGSSNCVGDFAVLRETLVALKPVESQDHVIHYAVSLGQKLKIGLEGCCVIDLSRLAPRESTPIGAGSFKAERDRQVVFKARQSATLNIQQLFKACSNHQVPCESHIYEGETVQILTDAAQRADLMICGNSDTGDIHEHSLLQKLLKQVARPVIVVPRGDIQSRAVLIAFDGSPQAGRALAAFAESGMAEDRDISLVCLGKDFKQANQIAQNAAVFLGRHHIAATIMSAEIDSDIAAQILQTANQVAAGLLVMGSFGNSAVREFFLGSVTKHVLKSSPIPVFLYH